MEFVKMQNKLERTFSFRLALAVLALALLGSLLSLALDGSLWAWTWRDAAGAAFGLVAVMALVWLASGRA